MIDPGHPRLSIVRQCELASISRSSFYREPTAETEAMLQLMRLIDEQFLETPWYGSRQMARHLRRNGWCVGRHRVRRLMSKMGLAPIYQRPKTSEPHPQHRIWPCLLRHLTIDRPNQVWCADVTYIPMRRYSPVDRQAPPQQPLLVRPGPTHAYFRPKSPECWLQIHTRPDRDLLGQRHTRVNQSRLHVRKRQQTKSPER